MSKTSRNVQWRTARLAPPIGEPLNSPIPPPNCKAAALSTAAVRKRLAVASMRPIAGSGCKSATVSFCGVRGAGAVASGGGDGGGGIWVYGDATLTDCSFIDCSSADNEGRSAAGYFDAPLVDTLKNCRFVRSSVWGLNIGKRDNTTKKITFCAGSSFTSCDLNHGGGHGGSVVDQGNAFAGGQCK